MAKSALLVEAKMLERDMEARMKSLGTKASKEALEEAEHVRLQVSTRKIRPSWQPIEGEDAGRFRLQVAYHLRNAPLLHHHSSVHVQRPLQRYFYI